MKDEGKWGINLPSITVGLSPVLPQPSSSGCLAATLRLNRA